MGSFGVGLRWFGLDSRRVAICIIVASLRVWIGSSDDVHWGFVDFKGHLPSFGMVVLIADVLC